MSVAPEAIRLSEDQQRRLAQLAEQTGQPWEALLAQALRDLELPKSPPEEQPESVRDALVRLGLLGCVHDAPADLSTNPAYLEGYGSNGP
jgi:predicted transcriptional regulator